MILSMNFSHVKFASVHDSFNLLTKGLVTELVSDLREGKKASYGIPLQLASLMLTEMLLGLGGVLLFPWW